MLHSLINIYQKKVCPECDRSGDILRSDILQRSECESDSVGGGARGERPPRESYEATSQPPYQTLNSTSPTEGRFRNEPTPFKIVVKKKTKTKTKSASKSSDYVPKKSTKQKTLLTETISKLADDWKDWALTKQPHWRGKSTYTHDYFVFHITEVQKYTNLSDNEMVDLFGFIANDSFWSDVAISPKSLLTSRNGGVKKIDNVLIKFRKCISRKLPLTEEEWNNLAF